MGRLKSTRTATSSMQTSRPLRFREATRRRCRPNADRTALSRRPCAAMRLTGAAYLNRPSRAILRTTAGATRGRLTDVDLRLNAVLGFNGEVVHSVDAEMS